MKDLIARMNSAGREIEGIFNGLAKQEDEENRGGRFVTVLLGVILTYMHGTTQPGLSREEARARMKQYLSECVDLVVPETDDQGPKTDDFTRFVPI